MRNRHANTHTFGQWLRRQIEDRDWTQEAFAERAGVSREHLCQLLADRHVPRGTTISRIARSLGVTREAVEARLPQAAAA